MKSISCGLLAKIGDRHQIARLTTPKDGRFAAQFGACHRFSLGRNGRILLTLTALALLGFVSQAYAQGCAMCLTGAMSQGVQAIQAMNLGILILLVPPLFMIIAVFTFLFLRRS